MGDENTSRIQAKDAQARTGTVRNREIEGGRVTLLQQERWKKESPFVLPTLPDNVSTPPRIAVQQRIPSPAPQSPVPTQAVPSVAAQTLFTPLYSYPAHQLPTYNPYIFINYCHIVMTKFTTVFKALEQELSGCAIDDFFPARHGYYIMFQWSEQGGLHALNLYDNHYGEKFMDQPELVMEIHNDCWEDFDSSMSPS
jgi:hypothetical protein